MKASLLAINPDFTIRNMQITAQQPLKAQLTKHLNGGAAFTPVDQLLKKMPFEKVGIIPNNLPYSFWQQLYHLRFAQLDILDFSTNSNYTNPNWPEDYWPKSAAPKNEQKWNAMIQSYSDERHQLCNLIENPGTDLFQKIPHGSGQTLLREALLVVEHTAYHTGEMLIIMRLLGVHS